MEFVQLHFPGSDLEHHAHILLAQLQDLVPTETESESEEGWGWGEHIRAHEEGLDWAHMDDAPACTVPGNGSEQADVGNLFCSSVITSGGGVSCVTDSGDGVRPSATCISRATGDFICGDSKQGEGRETLLLGVPF